MKVRYPERVVYPAAGFRKRDVLAYYERIAPVLLPHLRAAACVMPPFGNSSKAPPAADHSARGIKKENPADDER